MQHRADNPATAIAPIAIDPELMTRLDSDDALSLLAAGVPLSLMIDLAVPTSSKEILLAEGGNAEWLHARVA